MLLETAPADGEGHGRGRGHAAGLRPLVVPLRRAASSRASSEVEQLAGKRIATAYPVLLQRYLDERGIKAGVVKLDGAVETACRLGVADAVCDVVETGTTLRAAGLHIIGEPVLTSEAILVRREGAEEIPAVAQLRRRLRGVLVARQYVMLDYDCPNELLREGHRGHARASRGRRSARCRRRAGRRCARWCAQTETNRVMDELWELGARAILVTSIHASPHLSTDPVHAGPDRRAGRCADRRPAAALLLAGARCASSAGRRRRLGSSAARTTTCWSSSTAGDGVEPASTGR